MSATRAPTPTAEDEAARQAALDAYAILDSAPEQAFDDIVRLAVTLCDVPAGSISLIDRDRVWFKAQIGIDQTQVPRELFAVRPRHRRAGPHAGGQRPR